MRFILKVSLPPETFNEAVRDGSVGEKIGRILEDSKPEATYFVTDNGDRGAFLVIHMEDVSEMPKYAEPWFLTFDASAEFLPAMTPEDIAQAGLDELGEKWG